VIAFPVVLAGNLVVGVIAALAGKTHNQIALLPIEAGDTTGQVAFLLVAAVIVPCAEEILFRGYVYGRLEGLVRPTIAVALSAALFAGAHTWSASTGSITLVLQTFAMGLVLGWVRQHSKSIFPSMIAHAGNNAFALTLVLSCVNHPELGCART
jgi:membrane protease YdiL (CAAX protease family)